MVASRQAYQIMKAISKTYNIKKYMKAGLPYVPPDVYLGDHISKHWDSYDDSDYFWYTISGNHYGKNIYANVQKNLMYIVRELDDKQQPPFLTI